jgi:hypothetical protein
MHSTEMSCRLWKTSNFLTITLRNLDSCTEPYVFCRNRNIYTCRWHDSFRSFTEMWFAMFVKHGEILRSLSCDISQIASMTSILTHLGATYILHCSNLIFHQCMVPFQIEGLLSANMNSLVFFLQLKTRLQMTLAATKAVQKSGYTR